MTEISFRDFPPSRSELAKQAPPTTVMRRVLELVYEHQQKKMGPPSYVEIGDKLGISSKSGVHRLILSCQERGLVTRQNRRARTLMLTDWGLTFVQRAEEKVSQQCCPSCGAKLSIRLE